MDELRTTLNTVLDTVEKELAAARDAGVLLREVEKQRDEYAVKVERLRQTVESVNELWGWVVVVTAVVCMTGGAAIGWACSRM